MGSYQLVPMDKGGWGIKLPNGTWTGMMGMCYRGWPPYVNRKGVDHITGVMSRVLTVLSDHLSFCYQLVPMDKGGWGIKLPNGTWTGMMGMCYRGEVDVVLGPAGINEDRIADFDLSIPLFYDQQVIAYQRPKLEPELLGFIKPFTPMGEYATITSLYGGFWARKGSVIMDCMKEGDRMVLHERFAIIVDHTTILTLLHNLFSKVTPSWSKQNIEYRWNSFVRRLQEHGLLAHWMRQELLNSTYCLTPPGSEPIEQRALQLKDFYGVFSLFGLGKQLHSLQRSVHDPYHFL
nr:uncharacterized protein LOC128702058 [Cherax quadricarinatus]